MERITRIGTVFIIVTLVSLLAIITADGKLTWGTIGLVLILLLIAGLVVAVWTVVHGSFPTATEIGLTIAIVLMIVVVLFLAVVAGAEIYQELKDIVRNATVLWLIWPVIGTIVLTFVFGFHKTSSRPARPVRRP